MILPEGQVIFTDEDIVKIDPKPGDCFVLKTGAERLRLQQIEILSEELSHIAKGRVSLIVIEGDMELEKLREEEMNEYGWYRKEKSQEKSAKDF